MTEIPIFYFSAFWVAVILKMTICYHVRQGYASDNMFYLTDLSLTQHKANI